MGWSRGVGLSLPIQCGRRAWRAKRPSSIGWLAGQAGLRTQGGRAVTRLIFSRSAWCGRVWRGPVLWAGLVPARRGPRHRCGLSRRLSMPVVPPCIAKFASKAVIWYTRPPSQATPIRWAGPIRLDGLICWIAGASSGLLGWGPRRPVFCQWTQLWAPRLLEKGPRLR